MRKFLMILLLIGLCLAPFAALAVDYAIDSYEMTVDIKNDGSAIITETLLYSFEGEYNGILSTFDVADVEALVDLALYVDGDTKLRQVDELGNEPFTYTVTQVGGMLKVQAYAPGNGGSRTFRYEYQLLKLCQRYQDAGRLHYKLIGTGNQVTLNNALINISLPSQGYDAWAHGAAFNDNIRMEGKTVIVGPVNVASGQYVEVDILFNAASLYNASVISHDIMDETYALEEELAKAYEARMHRLEVTRYILIALLPVFIIAGLFMLRGGGLRIGFKKKNLKADLNLEKLKGITAAVAQYIEASTVDSYGLSGTLLELVLAGGVDMNKPKPKSKQMRFTVKNRDVPGLTEDQQYVLDWLFKTDTPLLASSLDAKGDVRRAQEVQAHFTKLTGLARGEAKAEGYLSEKGNFVLRWALPVIGLGVALVIGLAFMQVGWAAVLAAFWALALTIGMIKLRPLSDKGEEIAAALLGLKGQIDGGKEQFAGDMAWLLPISAALGYLEPFFKLMDRSWDEGAHWMFQGWQFDICCMQHRMIQVQESNGHMLQSSSGDGASSGGGGGGGGHGAW